jgi:hypothetical protein
VFHGDDVLVTKLSFDVITAIAQVGEELGLANLAALNLRTVDGPWARQVSSTRCRRSRGACQTIRPSVAQRGRDTHASIER